MPISIDENIREKQVWVAHVTPATVTMLEDNLEHCPDVTNSCSGGHDCPVKRFSLFRNGRPGKPHLAGAKENLFVRRYRLFFSGKTGGLLKAIRIGCCNHVTLELGSGRRIKRKKDVEEAVEELIEVLILFGNYMKNFKQVWSLTTDMTNKKAYNEFFSKVEETDWVSLIGFLGTPDFRKTIPTPGKKKGRRLRRSDRIEFDQKLKVKQLMCLEYIYTLANQAYKNEDLTPYEYDELKQDWNETRERVNNQGYPGETAFPPLRATQEQINYFLGVEGDPINLTQEFIDKAIEAANRGSMSLGTITIDDERHDLNPQN